MKLLRIMIAYERVVAAGGGETEDDHDIVYQSLIHPVMLLLSPNLPQHCKAQDHILPCPSLQSLKDPPRVATAHSPPTPTAHSPSQRCAKRYSTYPVLELRGTFYCALSRIQALNLRFEASECKFPSWVHPPPPGLINVNALSRICTTSQVGACCVLWFQTTNTVSIQPV